MIYSNLCFFLDIYKQYILMIHDFFALNIVVALQGRIWNNTLK